MNRLAIFVALTALATIASAQTIDDERRALAKAKTDSAAALQRSRAFDQQAEQERDEAAKARIREAAVAARIQAAEADISAAQNQVALIERLRRDQQSRLAALQGPIVRLVAALQTMARRPAAVAIVQPGSVSDLVHVRSLLSSVMPVINQRTEGLREEALRGEQLRKGAIAAVAQLRAGQDRLKAERLELAKLDADHRRRSLALANSATFESERAVALSEEARDISALMGDLAVQARVRDRLIVLPGPLLRPASPATAGTSPPENAALTAPRRPQYRLPVIGRVVTGLGEMTSSGVRSSGITIATTAGAQVVAPTSGRVAFAGSYRGYGRIAIIDHGNGWTSLITSLDQLNVKVGDLVEQGSPVGRAGPGRPTVTVELRRDGAPVDIARLVG